MQGVCIWEEESAYRRRGSVSGKFASRYRCLEGPPQLEKRAVRILLECFLAFFNFMQFLGKMAKIIGWRLSPGNFWIRHCNIYTWYLWLYLTISFTSGRRKLLLEWINYGTYLTNQWPHLEFSADRGEGHMRFSSGSHYVTLVIRVTRVQQSTLTISCSVKTLFRLYYMNTEPQIHGKICIWVIRAIYNPI